MAGREKPPGGPLDGAPEGGDDEYRSVVFDESFVHAARLQEFSARERLEDDEHAAVRSRPRGGTPGPRSAPQHGLALVLLVVVAFGTAVYMGLRNPLPNPAPVPAEPARMATVPLAPRGTVPGSTPADLFAHSPAAEFDTGAEGVALSFPDEADHFTKNEVLAALTDAKDYVVTTSLDPAVLTGGAVRPVRSKLSPGQRDQFDRSLEAPRSDGRHAATGWMVRFDPDQVALAEADVRVDGTLTVEETGRDALAVTSDHVFVYAVRAAGSGEEAAASLFTVRREIRFHFDREDLAEHRLRVGDVATRAGPMACSADHAATLTPLLAGERAGNDPPPGTDPYASDVSRGAVCGVLSDSARPDPVRGR